MQHFIYTLLFAAAIEAASAADWPQWRGLHRDGHTPETFPNLSALPEPSKSVWKVSIGGGFSSPVIAGDKLIYLDEQQGREVAHCLNARNGKLLWETPYAEGFGDEWGTGPRATPLIDEDRVYVQSCNGNFRCLSLKNGEEIWGISFEKDFGVKFLGRNAREGTASRRGNNGSPVINGNSVIVPVGNANGATLVCLDKKSGKVEWKVGNEEAAYSSLMVATLAGTKQVIAFAADSLMGVDRASGNLLWRVPLRTNAKRHAATPVIFGNNVLVNSHTFGLLSLRVSKAGSEFTAIEQWRNADLKINLSTPVIVGNTLYSQGTSGKLVAVDLGTGRQQWSREGFGKENSSIIASGDKLFVLTDSGQLFLLKADPTDYKEITNIQIAGKNWNYPAIANGHLFIRDQRELACYLLEK